MKMLRNKRKIDIWNRNEYDRQKNTKEYPKNHLIDALNFWDKRVQLVGIQSLSVEYNWQTMMILEQNSISNELSL